MFSSSSCFLHGIRMDMHMHNALGWQLTIMQLLYTDKARDDTRQCPVTDIWQGKKTQDAI